MVNNPLDYANRKIFLISFYSIYEEQYYITGYSKKMRRSYQDFNSFYALPRSLVGQTKGRRTVTSSSSILYI